MPDPRRLLKLAESVADGEATDWRHEEETAREEDRPKIRALGLISGFADACRKLADETPGMGPQPLGNWGHLELLEKIGSGTYGDVYRARDTQLDREVALKLLEPSDTKDESEERSLQEGRLLARIKHPNVATVYGADRRERRVGIWMELIRGRNLREIVSENGPLGAREATLIGIDLCRALAAVHAKGILHRDIKAQNVMREEGGRIVLMDFGIGRDLGTAPGATSGVAGTPLYLAPEVLEGEPETAQSEIYSLGVLLFFLVTGKFPVEGGSLEELKEAHRDQTPKLLRDLRQDLPDGYVRLVEKAIAAKSADRFSSLGELERSLSSTLRSGPGEETAGGESPGKRPSPLKITAAALLAVLSVAFLAVQIFNYAFLEPRLGQKAAILHKAEKLVGQQRFTQAISVSSEALETFPRPPSLYLFQAEVFDSLGQYLEADASMETAYRLSGSFLYRRLVPRSELLWIKARRSIYRMRHENAIEPLDQLTWTTPDRPDTDALYQLVMLYANLGDPEESVRQAREALLLAPGEPKFIALLAFQLAEANRSEKALAVLRNNLPASEEGWELLVWAQGLAHLVGGNLMEARESFSRILEGGPPFPSLAHRFLAQTSTLEAFATGPPGQPSRKLLLEARSLLEQGIRKDNELLKRADPLANVETRFTAEKARKLLDSASISLLLGEPQAAQEAVRQVERLPDVPILLKPLRKAALIEAQLGNRVELDNLRERIENICEDAPSQLCDATLDQLSGHARHLKGDGSGALEDLEKARAHRPDPIALASLLDIATQQGACEPARAAYKELEAFKGRILSQDFAGKWFLAPGQRSACSEHGS